jgi:hypothetical protein
LLKGAGYGLYLNILRKCDCNGKIWAYTVNITVSGKEIRIQRLAGRVVCIIVKEV